MVLLIEDVSFLIIQKLLINSNKNLGLALVCTTVFLTAVSKLTL